MSKMGGLAKIFTKTNWLFLIGVLALAGIPPLAPFFSKDLILEEESMTGHLVLFYFGLAASILTGVYLIRAYYLTFKNGLTVVDKSVKEAPNVMLIPVAILALLAIFGGLFGIPIEDFIDDITPLEIELSHGLHFSWELVLAVTGAFLGVIVTYFVYARYKDRLGQPITFLKKSFYLNEIYWKAIAVPFITLARFVADFLEPKVMDGSIHATAVATKGLASVIQQVQSGQIRSYVAWMLLGALSLILILVLI
jgi:NADH-quinone oxidoreductase subunit L